MIQIQFWIGGINPLTKWIKLFWFFQIIISIFLITSWQRIFKDWLFILYPIFGIIFTTFFGTNLSISGNQFWHLFIGPSGTISVLTLYLVLKRSEKKFT